MRIHFLKKRNPWIIWAIAIPAAFWFLSETLPLLASGLNQKGYQRVKKNPLEASGILTLRTRDSVHRKSVKNIILPLTRKSDPRFDHDRFDLRIIGLLEVEKPGFYGIGTESDDGSWIWIDGEKILDNGGLHPRQKKKDLIHVQKGLHLIELKFENLMGEAYLDAFWVPPDEPPRPIPLLPHPWGRVASNLYGSAPLFFKMAQYWVFFLIPLLLYKILFPTGPVGGETPTSPKRGKPGW